MGRISNSKKIKLLRIEKAKLELGRELERQFINEGDIMYMLSKDVNFGTEVKREFLRRKILKDIMNCPFLLCDQEYLSPNIKAILPSILISRFNIEKNELDYQFENFYITEEKYNNEISDLEYFYFKSSEEGKEIFKNIYQKIK